MVESPFTVIPTVGFEFARFGEPRSRHRQRLGAFESFRRNPDFPKLTDLYVDTLMSLDYDDNDRLEFIEIIDFDAVVYVEDIQFVRRPLDEIIALMTQRGHTVVGPYAGTYAIPALGIRFGGDYDGENDAMVTDGISLVAEETIPQLRGRPAEGGC